VILVSGAGLGFHEDDPRTLLLRNRVIDHDGNVVPVAVAREDP
jgi:hypothetical protein